MRHYVMLMREAESLVQTYYTEHFVKEIVSFCPGDQDSLPSIGLESYKETLARLAEMGFQKVTASYFFPLDWKALVGWTLEEIVLANVIAIIVCTFDRHDAPIRTRVYQVVPALLQQLKE